MNEYWQQQHGLTPDEKAAFVERVQAEQAAFPASLPPMLRGNPRSRRH